MEKRILVVDFEANDLAGLAALEQALGAEAMSADVVHDVDATLARWKEAPPDAVLVAVDGEAMRHRDLVREVRRAYGEAVPLLFYGRGDPGEPVRAPSEAIAQGGDYFFRLPCDFSYLAGRVRAWTERGARPAEAPPAPVSEAEAPVLEGFDLTRSGWSAHPLLERLRQRQRAAHATPAPAPAPTPTDWSWAEAMDEPSESSLAGLTEAELNGEPPATSWVEAEDADLDDWGMTGEAWDDAPSGPDGPALEAIAVGAPDHASLLPSGGEAATSGHETSPSGHETSPSGQARPSGYEAPLSRNDAPSSGDEAPLFGDEAPLFGDEALLAEVRFELPQDLAWAEPSVEGEPALEPASPEQTGSRDADGVGEHERRALLGSEPEAGGWEDDPLDAISIEEEVPTDEPAPTDDLQAAVAEAEALPELAPPNWAPSHFRFPTVEPERARVVSGVSRPTRPAVPDAALAALRALVSGTTAPATGATAPATGTTAPATGATAPTSEAHAPASDARAPVSVGRSEATPAVDPLDPVDPWEDAGSDVTFIPSIPRIPHEPEGLGAREPTVAMPGRRVGTPETRPAPVAGTPEKEEVAAEADDSFDAPEPTVAWAMPPMTELQGSEPRASASAPAEASHRAEADDEVTADRLDPLPGLRRRLRRAARMERAGPSQVQPTPAAEPERLPEPERAAEPEWLPEPERAAEPEWLPEPERAAGPEWSPEPERAAEPEWLPEPERAAEPEASSQPEPISAPSQFNLPDWSAPPPSAPIAEDEDTQELFLAPLVAGTSAGADFPPGALTIVEQAELQRQRGQRDEAVAGYALAAQIYIDHGMEAPAIALYRRVLDIAPENSLAKERLHRLLPEESHSPEANVVVEPALEPRGAPAPSEPASGSPVPASAAISVDDLGVSMDDLALDDGEQNLDRSSFEAFLDDLDAAVSGEPPKLARPSDDVPLGALRPTSMAPDHGEVWSLPEMVNLFLRARAQRSTGVLRFRGGPGVLLAHGVPAGLVGDEVLPAFLRLAADVGWVGESKARQLLDEGRALTPRAMARRLRRLGYVDGDEELMLPTRQLEDRLVRVLQQRGGWLFEPVTSGACTDDLVPPRTELRAWLVDLLPRACPEEDLRIALGLGAETVRLVPGTEHFLPPLEQPLAQLLDGYRGLEEAARLGGVPVARALAWALVWLSEGLAERVRRCERPNPETSEPRRRVEPARPQLADLPPLRPRRTPGNGFRLTRTPGSTPPAVRLPPPSEDSTLSGLEAEDRVKAMAERVRTRDYFGILEVDPGASRKAIDDAHRRIRGLVPQDVTGDLEGMVREVLRSVDEARDILMIPELRAAYAHHLEPQ